MWGFLYEFVLLLVEFQLVYKRLGTESSSVMTGFVLISFSGRVLVVQEVLGTVIIAPYRKVILVLCRFCRCVLGTLDPGRSRVPTTYQQNLHNTYENTYRDGTYKLCWKNGFRYQSISTSVKFLRDILVYLLANEVDEFYLKMDKINTAIMHYRVVLVLVISKCVCSLSINCLSL